MKRVPKAISMGIEILCWYLVILIVDGVLAVTVNIVFPKYPNWLNGANDIVGSVLVLIPALYYTGYLIKHFFKRFGN